VLYLLVNWVFVANLTPEQCKVVFTYESERVTLGHLIMKNVVGDFGASCMSILAIIAFISAASAMTFLGPRVYAAMARDGFLPRVLQGKEGKPPIGAVILQGGIALFIVLRYQLQTILNNVGAILTVFSALTVFSLFWIRFKRKDLKQPGLGSLAAAFCYLLLSGLMLYFGSKTLYKEFAKSPSLLAWAIGIMVIIVAGYFIARRKAILNPPIATQDADI
jgi:APA family basic amino acid/polyamine antiporter